MTRGEEAGKEQAPRSRIEEGELRDLPNEYWDAMSCDELKPASIFAYLMRQLILAWGEPGSGAAKSQDIDGFCDERLEFSAASREALARVWSGVAARVNGIAVEARSMAGRLEAPEPDDGALHAGMKGTAVRDLQQKLRALGYPSGAVDGVFGEQTTGNHPLQHDHDWMVILGFGSSTIKIS